MPITEAVRSERHKAVGSSDIGALFNWGWPSCPTIMDLWYRKTFPESFANDTPTAMMVAGNRFEDGILDDFEETMNVKLERQVRKIDPAACLACNVDGIIEGSGEPAEAKFHTHLPTIDEYGDPMSDIVPARTTLQCHGHLIVTNQERCWVHAWLGLKGFRTFVVYRNDELVRMICERANRLMEAVREKRPPLELVDDQHCSAETLALIPRDARRVELEADVIDAYAEAAAACKRAEEIKGQARALVLQRLGDAEEGTDGERLVTFREVTQMRLNSSMIKTMYPDIAADCTKKSTYRSLRVGKLK